MRLEETTCETLKPLARMFGIFGSSPKATGSPTPCTANTWVHARYGACQCVELGLVFLLSLRRERVRWLEKILQVPRTDPNDHDPQPFCPGSDRPSPTPSSRLPDCGTPQNHAPFTNQLPTGSRTLRDAHRRAAVGQARESVGGRLPPPRAMGNAHAPERQRRNSHDVRKIDPSGHMKSDQGAS